MVGKKICLNLQAICDHMLRFIDVDISHPATTSDYLAFCTSSILIDLEKDWFLKSVFCLYGDNAYVNTNFMASPFKGTSSGPKDACNFSSHKYESILNVLLVFLFLDRVSYEK